jgi:type VI secretion system protein ImpC
MEAKQQGATRAAASAGTGLLDQIMAQTKMEPSQEGYLIARKGVAEFIAEMLKSNEQAEPVNKRLVDQMIVELDQKIGQQMDEVLHHPELQKLESAWRGLKVLVDRTDFRENIKIQVLHVMPRQALAEPERERVAPTYNSPTQVAEDSRALNALLDGLPGSPNEG